jgi:hypothetical protein
MKFLLKVFCESKDEYNELVNMMNGHQPPPEIEAHHYRRQSPAVEVVREPHNEIKCALEGCENMFIPIRKDSRYCSKKCYRIGYQALYKKDPTIKQKNITEKLAVISATEPAPRGRPKINREIG